MYTTRSPVMLLIPMAFLVVVAVVVVLMIFGQAAPSAYDWTSPARTGGLTAEEEQELEEAVEWAEDTFKQPTVNDANIVASKWLEGAQLRVRAGLTINPHAAKHNGEAEKIYKMLLEGKCAGTGSFCRKVGPDKLHVCIDPVTGVVGAILEIVGDEIYTGYFESNKGRWYEDVKQNWRRCK